MNLAVGDFGLASNVYDITGFATRGVFVIFGSFSVPTANTPGGAPTFGLASNTAAGSPCTIGSWDTVNVAMVSWAVVNHDSQFAGAVESLSLRWRSLRHGGGEKSRDFLCGPCKRPQGCLSADRSASSRHLWKLQAFRTNGHPMMESLGDFVEMTLWASPPKRYEKIP